MMTTQTKNIQIFIIGVLSTLVVVLAGWVGYDKFLKPKSEKKVMASVSEPAASEPVIQASSEPVLEIQAKEADPTQKTEEGSKGKYLGNGLYTSDMNSGKCLDSAKVTCGLFEVNQLPKEWQDTLEKTWENNTDYWFSITDGNKVTSIPSNWTGWQVMKYGPEQKYVLAIFYSAYTNTGECLLMQNMFDIKTKQTIDSVELTCTL
ncbi:hypothetical protein JUNP543_2979 [Acinetobacter baumannii]|uniref:Uncharacterized protein n=4 Tax=Acinetobacter baumannii TaxID=470 RepID=A0A7U3Y4S4_ACIB5|nr:hypothetical protein AB57_0653 [Acinetobacter baumannii AB0057]AJF80544.1 hypothetical protein ABA1_00624 [Acinetobacter baumannii]ENW34452.1 hypothetical protein F921_03185 [Acinetobacter baumannii NIPH 527]ENW60579.1 hypothetical protein F914_03190 [Acinetobacter baumannii NIPH 290]ENW71473.1 hypothetical protein F912_00580 [Acinetobacter baumannii ANC 4097]EZF19856.1 hypothetical protein BA73_01381 [Acinetobacter baumannii R1B]MBD0444641.1 hypothetical protein [Acinetobacter nosocomiali